MKNDIYFRHSCGIEYRGLTSLEVQKLLDATKGDILQDFWLNLNSEWDHDDSGKAGLRKETYTVRIGERRDILKTDEHFDIDEVNEWHSTESAKLENIVKLIEEALA